MQWLRFKSLVSRLSSSSRRGAGKQRGKGRRVLSIGAASVEKREISWSSEFANLKGLEAVIDNRMGSPAVVPDINTHGGGGDTKSANLRTKLPSDTNPMDKLPEDYFPDFIKNLDAVLFDCDGVLWIGMNPIKGAQELVIKLRALGKKVFFLTNNSTKTRVEFLEKFNTLGFQATLDEIVATSYLAALYLKEQNFQGKAYVIGTTGITGELSNVGIEALPIGPDPMSSEMTTWVASHLTDPILDPEVKAVVVGFDHHLSYVKLYKAASYLKNLDCLFVATNTDERFPSGPNFVLPGTGSIVNAVKTAAEREPVVMGKPHPFAFEFVQRSHNLAPSRALMIGDRANTDILFGRNCGMWTLLVLSGVTTMDEVKLWQASEDPKLKDLLPDFYLDDVSSFLDLLHKYKF